MTPDDPNLVVEKKLANTPVPKMQLIHLLPDSGGAEQRYLAPQGRGRCLINTGGVGGNLEKRADEDRVTLL